ncbi:hypothetical protein [Pseudomonas sp. FSL R10-0071]
MFVYLLVALLRADQN